MNRQIDPALARVLAHWVDGVRRRAQPVAIALLVATLSLAIYTVASLGINSDNLSLLPPDLPSRASHNEFIRHFPNLEDALFVVVDAETPELARSAAAALTERMNAEPEYFYEAYLPGGGDFFDHNGLLYRSPDELDEFADAMARMQPLVASLEAGRQPGPYGRARAVSAWTISFRMMRSTEQWVMVLDRVGDATVAIYHEYPLAISWEEVLLEGSALEVSTRRTIVVHPVLDFRAHPAWQKTHPTRSRHSNRTRLLARARRAGPNHRQSCPQ